MATDQGARAQHRVHVKRDMSQGAATAFLRVKFWVNIEVVLEKKKIYGKLLQIYTGVADFSTSNCAFDSLSDTTTHQQVGMLSK